MATNLERGVHQRLVQVNHQADLVGVLRAHRRQQVKVLLHLDGDILLGGTPGGAGPTAKAAEQPAQKAFVPLLLHLKICGRSKEDQGKEKDRG